MSSENTSRIEPAEQDRPRPHGTGTFRRRHVPNSKARRRLSDEYNAVATKSGTSDAQGQQQRRPSRTKRFFRRIGRCLSSCFCPCDDSDSGSVVTRPSGNKSSSARSHPLERNSLPHPLRSHPVTLETIPAFLRNRITGHVIEGETFHGDGNSGANDNGSDNGETNDNRTENEKDNDNDNGNDNDNDNDSANAGKPSYGPRGNVAKLPTIESEDESRPPSKNQQANKFGDPPEHERRGQVHQGTNAAPSEHSNEKEDTEKPNNVSRKSLQKLEGKTGETQGSPRSRPNPATDGNKQDKPFDASESPRDKEAPVGEGEQKGAHNTADEERMRRNDEGQTGVEGNKSSSPGAGQRLRQMDTAGGRDEDNGKHV